LELSLFLAGTKDQNRFCVSKMRDHLIIVRDRQEINFTKKLRSGLPMFSRVLSP
jgi:hypothetical protein